MSIELPPTPATVEDAVTLSNLYAYNGNPKNTLDYWGPHYHEDPFYYWRRMLGWEAGGDDVALSGLYAQPDPTPWYGATPVPTQTPVPEPPVPPTAIQTIEDQLTAITETLKTLATKQDIADARQQFTNAVKQLPAQLAAGGILGGIFGKREAPPKKTGKK